MFRSNIARIYTRRFDGIDQPEDLRDLGPTMDRKQDVSAWVDLLHGCAFLA